MQRIVWAIFSVLCLSGCPGEMQQEDWIEYTKLILPESECDQQDFTMQCFNVAEEQCVQTMTQNTNFCLDGMKAKIPERLSPKDEYLWHEKISKCAVTRVETQFANHRKNNPKCDVLRNLLSPNKSQSPSAPLDSQAAWLDTRQGK